MTPEMEKTTSKERGYGNVLAYSNYGQPLSLLKYVILYWDYRKMPL